MIGKASRYLLSVGAVVSLAFLSGCAPWDWLKEKLGMGTKSYAAVVATPSQVSTQPGGMRPAQLRGKDDKVLVTVDGVPAITLKSFEEEVEKLVEADQRMQMALQFQPDLKYKLLTDEFVNRLVIDKYIAENKIDQSEEYKKDLERALTQIKRALDVNYFFKAHPVKVSDSEVKKFYEENKDQVPGILISAGGTLASGIKFDKEDAAKAFYDKVKGKSKEFDEISKKEGLTDKVQDFKLVTDKSIDMNATLRTKIMALKRFPAVEMVKVSDKELWVVNAPSKEEKQYIPFEEIKDRLKGALEQKKQMEEAEKIINSLKGKYNIVIDEEAAAVLKPAPIKEEKEAAEGFDSPEKPEAPSVAQAPARATKTA